MKNKMVRMTETLGVNRTVLALSIARMGDAVGNSILSILIPLYIVKLPRTGGNFFEFFFLVVGLMPVLAAWIVHRYVPETVAHRSNRQKMQ